MQSHSREATGTVTPFDKYAESKSRSDCCAVTVAKRLIPNFVKLSNCYAVPQLVTYKKAVGKCKRIFWWYQHIYWRWVLETNSRHLHSLQQWITLVNAYRKGQMHIQGWYRFFNAFSHCRGSWLTAWLNSIRRTSIPASKNELTQLKIFVPESYMVPVKLWN